VPVYFSIITKLDSGKNSKMPLAKKEKVYTAKEAFLKISSFCAYQERTQQEVRDKLCTYGLHIDIVEEIISRLIVENFINEERFAKTYAGSKFRQKKWGRLKILRALKEKGLSEHCIKKGMAEIEVKAYHQTLEELIKTRDGKEREKNIYKRKHKIAQFLIGKGYEAEEVWESLNKLMMNDE
jgi:regulatory protein